MTWVMLQVEVVDDRGQLVRWPAVGADERRTLEAKGAFGIRSGDLAGGFDVPLPALALPHRALVPDDPEPVELAQDLLLGTELLRATSVSSIRRTSAPSCSSAKLRLATAVNAPPRCSDPVGLGAKRTLTTGDL